MFQGFEPICEIDWDTVKFVYKETPLGDFEEIVESYENKVLGFNITGRLLILRKTKKVKVIKKAETTTTTNDVENDREYEINDSLQLTLRLNRADADTRRKINLLQNCAISATLNEEGPLCELYCVPLNSDNTNEGRFKLSVQLVRIRKS